MVSYGHNAPTFLNMILIQIASMPHHLSAQKITKSIDYNMSIHLYGTI